MKRVLHYGLSENLGGIETFIYKLAENINRNDYIFDFLITGSTKPVFYEELEKLGSRFHYVTHRRMNPIKNKKEVEAIFSNGKYDVFHAHLNSLSYIEPVNIAVKKNVPTIVHSHNASLSGSTMSKVLHGINNYLLPKTDTTNLAVSNKAGEWMFGETPFQIVNNGVDTKQFAFSKESRLKIRKEMNVSETESLILHVGAFREQKNHDFLIDIFNEYQKINIESKLILIGAGSLESLIRDKVDKLGLSDRVIFAGLRNDVSAFISAADAFLFPSLHEGFPIAVIEAEASGLNCLISDVITDEILINSNCVNFPLDKSSSDWAAKLEWLITSNQIDRGRAADKFKNSKFSIENEIINIEKIYREITTK